MIFMEFLDTDDMVMQFLEWIVTLCR